MAVSTGTIVNLNGIVTEVIKNEALGSRYRIAVRTQGKLSSLYMEEDEFSGSQDINGAVTVPARVESVLDDEVAGVTVKVRIKANDTLVHLTVSENDISGGGSGSNSGSGSSGGGNISDTGDNSGDTTGTGDNDNTGSDEDNTSTGSDTTGGDDNTGDNTGTGDDTGTGDNTGSGDDSGNTTTAASITISAVDYDTELFGTLVGDMQQDVQINSDNIAAVLKPLSSGALVDRWGAGYFIALAFDSDEWDNATSIKVGLDPSEGDGLVEIKDDPDKNGVFKITNPRTQVFVVEVDDDVKLYDLSEVVFSS